MILIPSLSLALFATYGTRELVAKRIPFPKMKKIGSARVKAITDPKEACDSAEDPAVNAEVDKPAP